MNIEGGGISVSTPITPSFGGFSAPTMEIGPIGMGPTFSFVNEGPALIGSFENFSPLIPSAPDLGGTIGSIEALNSAFPIAEPQPMANTFNEGPVGLPFLENTRPLGVEDFSYSPRVGIDVMVNPFLEPIIDSSAAFDHFDTLDDVASDVASDVVFPFRYSYSDPISETKPLEWIMPGFLEPVPKEIKIGVAVPLVEDEKETQVQLEAVREELRGLTAKVSKLHRTVQVVRPDQAILPQEAVENKVVYAIKEEEGTPSKAKEKATVEVRQRKLIRDFKALEKRLSDARQAIENAFNQVTKRGNKTVNGENIANYIPDEYFEVRSGVLKKKSNDDIPDGSYVLGKAAIREITQTSSKDEMQTKVNEAIYGNGPVTESNSGEGEEATEKEVEKVYLFRTGRPPVRIVERRIIKKKEIVNSQTAFGENTKISEVPAEMETEEESEDVKSLLKEVFKIAA